MAGRPLRPATDRRLGGPLPHQQANQPSAAHRAPGPKGSPALIRGCHAVLANLSAGCPPPRGTFRCLTHPSATRRQAEARAAVRLACVKHAASVQSEPGSNSSVQSLFKTSFPSLSNLTDKDIHPYFLLCGRPLSLPHGSLRRPHLSSACFLKILPPASTGRCACFVSGELKLSTNQPDPVNRLRKKSANIPKKSKKTTVDG